MRVLLTAFEPFDGTGLNSSLEGCRYFLARWANDFDLRFAVLPVEYGADVEAVEQALSEGPVDVLLHTGQATGASCVRVERLAVNLRYAPGETRAWGRPSQPIEPDGPLALLSTLDADALAEAIHGERVPVTVSNHAGIYLCNHALYHSLRRRERQGEGQRVGFLHVPCLPSQAPEGAASLTEEQTGRAIRAALRHLLG